MANVTKTSSQVVPSVPEVVLEPVCVLRLECLERLVPDGPSAAGGPQKGGSSLEPDLIHGPRGIQTHAGKIVVSGHCASLVPLLFRMGCRR